MLQTKYFFELSPIPMCVCGFDGTIKKVNKAFLRITSHTQEEELYKITVSGLVAPDSLESTYNVGFKTLIAQGEIENFTNTILTAKQEERIVSWSAIADFQNKLIYAVIKGQSEKNVTTLNLTFDSNSENKAENFACISFEPNGRIIYSNERAQVLMTNLGLKSTQESIQPYVDLINNDFISVYIKQCLTTISFPDKKFIAPGIFRTSIINPDSGCFHLENRILPKYKDDIIIGFDLLINKEETEYFDETVLYNTALNKETFEFISKIPTAVAIFDIHGKIIHCSEKWNEEQGNKDSINPEWKNTFENYFPSELEIFTKAIQGETIRTEIICLNQFDQEIYYLLEAHPWVNSAGEIIGIFVFLENITIHKIAEEAIQERSIILNGVLRNLPVILLKIKPSGIIENVIGNTASTIFKKDIRGIHITEIFPENKNDIKEWFNGNFIKIISEIKVDENLFCFLNHAFPHGNSGDLICFSLDITEKHKIEKDLIKAKENAEKANELKTNFITSITHEIRTPLNAIVGFASTLRYNESAKERHEYIDYILSASDTLLKLINGILDLRKIEKGQVSINKQAFNLREEFRNGLKPFHKLINQKKLDFFLNIDNRVPDFLNGDVEKIKQILINLIGNSIKFTPTGFISIDIRPASTDCSNGTVDLTFTVKDTGIGIPMEKQKIIFEPFVQSTPEVAHQYGGSGLGLAIVKDLVKLMGGKIEVTSPIDGIEAGTQIKFNIPVEICEAPPVKSTEFETQYANGYNLHILIVEDNKLNQRLFALIMKMLKCNYVIVNNGQECLAIAETGKFDLILMDVLMPVMNGIDATITLRKMGITTPIIGVTANSFIKDMKYSLEAGMNDFISKPFTAEQLKDIIKKWTLQKIEGISNTQSSHKNNFEYLLELSDGDMESFSDLLKSHQKQMLQLCNNIKEAIGNKNTHAIKSYAHKLTPTLKALGAEDAAAFSIRIQKFIDEQAGINEIGSQFFYLEQKIKKLSMDIEKHIYRINI